MPEPFKFKSKPAIGFKKKDGTVTKEDPTEFRKYAAMFVRGASGFTPGGFIGAGAGALGEGLAQTIEGRDEFNYPSIAAASVMNAIPFGSTANVGRALIKGGMLGGVGTALGQQTEKGMHIPDSGDIRDIAVGTVLGGAGGDVSSRIVNRMSRVPSNMPEVIAPRNIPNIAAEGMTGNREVFSFKPKVSELPTSKQETEKVRKAKGTERIGPERIRTGDPSEGRKIMEEITNPSPFAEVTNLEDIARKGMERKARNGIMDETGSLNVTLSKAPQIYVPKAGLSTTDVINAPKALGASLDVSFPGRQGLWMAGRKEWYKSWAPMMKSLTSEDSYRKLQDSITNHPKFTEAVSNGLSLTDFAGVAVPKGMKTKAIGRLAEQEEQFGTRLVEQFTGGKYSPFRASNRAYSAFANNLRMSMYDNLTNKANKLAQKGGPIADRKMIAEYINSGSGRGSMGLTVGGKSDTLEKASELLNTVFWSPRFLASRVQLMNVPGNFVKMDKFTRQEYLRDMITAVVGGTTVLGIANLAGASVNLNPLEADFAKAKIGNTRVDLTGGFGPLIRFVSQGVNGVLDISEKDADGPNAWKFVESKLSPGARFIKEMVSGKDYFNRDITPGQSTVNLITPMIAKDFYELYQNDPELFPIGGLALVGVSVQSYKDRNKGKMPSLSTSFPKMPSISN